jgi:protein-S-isoprenylcysteine O-methyltransferase Ste14
MDVTTDGFGFMLAFGDLVWVPFTYSLQARYILERGESLQTPTLLMIVAVKLLGYAIFRGSNGQKNLFRTDPEDKRVAHLKYLPTRRGTRLLIDGWWGIARHVNYLGDWLMAWAWCLPCGFNHVVPYFYVVYFGVLLFHRDLRDGEQCELKYGEDWKKYCAIVKYRLIPYVY